MTPSPCCSLLSQGAGSCQVNQPSRDFGASSFAKVADMLASGGTATSKARNETMMVSIADSREAERIAKAQRIAAGRYLRVDETKITSPKDTMLLHRVKAAAAERSGTFDVMLGDRDVNRLFNGGVLYFERPGQ